MEQKQCDTQIQKYKEEYKAALESDRERKDKDYKVVITTAYIRMNIQQYEKDCREVLAVSEQRYEVAKATLKQKTEVAEANKIMEQ